MNKLTNYTYWWLICQTAIGYVLFSIGLVINWLIVFPYMLIRATFDKDYYDSLKD